MDHHSIRDALRFTDQVGDHYESPYLVSPRRDGLWRLGTALGRPQTLF